MANRFLSNIRINDAYTFPASDGSFGQAIITDGAGNLSFGNVASGGGADAASVIYKDNFTGDGTTVAFSMARSVTTEDQTQIFIDGVYQEKGTYSVSGNVITFSEAPISGHSIEVMTIASINTGPTTLYQDNFTGNGATTDFTLANSVNNEIKTLVFLNGVYQFKDTYSVSGTTLSFDTAPANGTLIEVITIGSAAAADYNQTLLFYGKASAAITKGQAVMFAGVQGDHFLVAPAVQATIDTNHEYMLGIANQDFANNEFGYVTEFGRVSGLNTSAYTAGAIIWYDSASATAGAITTTEPTPPNAKIQLAAVIRSHAAEGVLFVRPHIYYGLEELENVNVTGLADRDLLVYNNSTGNWVNDTLDADEIDDTSTTNKFTSQTEIDKLAGIEAGAQVNTLDGSGTANYVSKWSDADTITNSVITDDGSTVTISGDLSATNIAGTLSTTAQTNITSVGTLSSLAVSGVSTFGGSQGGLPVILKSRASDNINGILFQNNSGTTLGQLQVNSSSDYIFYNTSSDAERMRITSAGNVGIGTSSPGSYYSKELVVSAGVEGGITIVSNSTDGAYLMFADGTSGADRYRGYVNYSHLTNELTFGTNGSQRVTVDSSGNVGIGTSSPTEGNLVVRNDSGNANINIKVNDFDGSDYSPSLDFSTGGQGANDPQAQIKALGDNSYSAHLIFSTQNPGTTNPLVERMRILSSGQVIVGAFGGNDNAVVAGSSSPGFTNQPGTNLLLKSGDGSGTGSSFMSFSTSPGGSSGTTVNTAVERMRITSAGEVLIGTTTVLNGKITAKSPSSYTAFNFRSDSSSANNTDWMHFYGTSNSNTVQNIVIFGNGNILNANNSYGQLSDFKIKENIVDATPKLDDLLKVKVRNYNLIGDDNKQIGVVAQELEEVFPSMIDESPDFEEVEVTDEEGNVTTERVDLGTTTKSVKYSVFVPMLIKAVQELKAEIETLKSQING
jgi:hypothetical protein